MGYAEKVLEERNMVRIGIWLVAVLALGCSVREPVSLRTSAIEAMERATRFEPPAISGSESFDVMRSLLPDGQMARFYELRTNKPLYFTMEYELTYSDEDMPTHYGFKVSGKGEIDRVQAYYDRILKAGREAALKEKRAGNPGRVRENRVRRVIEALDERGRWVERGQLKHPEDEEEEIETDTISCETFNRNLRLLAKYVKSLR